MSINEVVCSFDIECAGSNVHKNSILQIGAVVMELDEFGEIKIHDIFDVCIKLKDDVCERRNEIIKNTAIEICILPKNNEMSVRDLCYKMNMKIKDLGTEEEFEKRCLEEFWHNNEHPKKRILLKEILDNGVDKRLAYEDLFHFLVGVRKKFPNILNISDNSPVDLARISLEFQKYDYNSLEFIGGKYNGFGLDTEDFIKGVSFAKKWNFDEYDHRKLTNFEEEFKKLVEKNKNLIKKKTKVLFQEHSAVYDAIKIGQEYLLVKNLLK